MRSNGLEYPEPQPDSSLRRKLLGWLVGFINLGVIAGFIAPVLGFISSTANRRRREEEWIPILDVHELHPGETRLVIYQAVVQDGYMWANRRYSVYLYRRSDGTIVAFDPSCPHLGCRVEFKERKQRYVCPCHGGVFDVEGNLVSGPPPTGLSRLATRVDRGKIWIQRV
jgi:Rieske Fe-S protein